MRSQSHHSSKSEQCLECLVLRIFLKNFNSSLPLIFCALTRSKTLKDKWIWWQFQCCWCCLCSRSRRFLNRRLPRRCLGFRSHFQIVTAKISSGNNITVFIVKHFWMNVWHVLSLKQVSCKVSNYCPNNEELKLLQERREL